MMSSIITQFTPIQKSVVNFQEMIKQNTDIPEIQYLGTSLTAIQKTLKEMFFSQQT